MNNCETKELPMTLPIPPAEQPGCEFFRDGFTAAYMFKREENRLFLMEAGGTMTEIVSPEMREVILAIGERISLAEALLVLAAERPAVAAIA